MYKQEGFFSKVGKTLKPAKDTKNVINQNGNFIIQDKKNQLIVNKVISDSTICVENGEKYFLKEVDVDTLDIEDEDVFGFDSFGNAYIISGEKYKIFSDKKAKAIKEKEIISAIFYQENDQIFGLNEFEFEGVQTVKKFKP